MKNRIVELQLEAFPNAHYFLIRIDSIDKGEIDENLLSNADIQRAMRYLSQKDSDRSLLVYAVTKRILADFLGIRPSQLSFSRNRFGKPYLEGYPLHFNLSHSELYAFLGVHPTLPIGVDIERTRKAMPLDSFLDPTEKAWLCYLPTQLWSAKEAYVKALGIGFSQSMPVLTPLRTSDAEGVSCFIARISQTFPSLLVKECHNVINDYHLAACINTDPHP